MRTETEGPLHFAEWLSPIGWLRLAATPSGLLSLSMHGMGKPGSKTDPCGHPVLSHAIAWLQAYFHGQKPDPADVPLVQQGTAFQNLVWHAVRDIPYGACASYGQIAAAIRAGSPRAVGHAVGRNPVALFVPCHRVVMANGQLCGYAWGREIKLWLLRHEGICRAHGQIDAALFIRHNERIGVN